MHLFKNDLIKEFGTERMTEVETEMNGISEFQDLYTGFSRLVRRI